MFTWRGPGTVIEELVDTQLNTKMLKEAKEKCIRDNTIRDKNGISE